MDQWLVRTTHNRIDGPFTREQVIGLIREGKLGLQDEVCPANGYWIYLHEQHEVREHLGIEMPRSARSSGGVEEEVTETQTETDVDVAPLQTSVAPKEPPTGLPDDYDGSTAVISRLPPKSPQAQPVRTTPASAPAPRREP